MIRRWLFKPVRQDGFLGDKNVELGLSVGRQGLLLLAIQRRGRTAMNISGIELKLGHASMDRGAFVFDDRWLRI